MDLRQLGTFGYFNEGLLSGSVWTTGVNVTYFHDMSGQLKSPQRIICFCFELLAIVVRDLLSSCLVLLHRCGM